MKDDDFKLLRDFALGLMDKQTNHWTDICDCRVAFATEKQTNLIVEIPSYIGRLLHIVGYQTFQNHFASLLDMDIVTSKNLYLKMKQF